MKLLSWNINRPSTKRFERQLAALREFEPDVVALQEVSKGLACETRKLLRNHVFASQSLDATAARYLHALDTLSDHSPLEVTFEPTTADPTATTTSAATTKSKPTTRHTTAADDVLTYARDIRNPNPSPDHRGAFKRGWTDAVNGKDYNQVLETLTWQNLGWRLGKLFGETSPELVEEMYKWCVAQQTNQPAETD